MSFTLLELKITWIMCKESFHTAQYTLFGLVMETNLLMLYSEIISVLS